MKLVNLQLTVRYRYPKGSTSHPDSLSTNEPDRSRLPATKESQINVKKVNRFVQGGPKRSELILVQI